MRNFANLYYDLIAEMSLHKVDIDCCGKKMAYEIKFGQYIFDCSNDIYIHSHKNSRVFPIKFALAELAWILSGSNRLDEIAKFNKAMVNFSDDGLTLYGAYGHRLDKQIEACIKKLVVDKHSRQAFATIYHDMDVHTVTKDVPCNTSLQFLIRDNQLNLIVNSRSSDFITGFPIDSFHWQMLLHLVCNELKETYNDLQYGHIIYNIASLHVYESDKTLLIDWLNSGRIDSINYMYVLHIGTTYSNVKQRAIELFPITSSLGDLMVIFSIYHHESMIDDLHNLFINYKNKLVR